MIILVVSDIHANLDALDAVLADAAGKFSGFLCLGDLVGYGPDPGPCVKTVRALADRLRKVHIVAGNHEAALAGRMNERWFNQVARRTIAYNRKVLFADDIEWLSSLPDRDLLADMAPGALAVHGSPLEPLSGYLFGGEETFEALSCMADTDIRLCFCGHTHEAAVYSAGWTDRSIRPVDGDAWTAGYSPAIVNPGSVGFPRAFNRELPSEPVSVESFPAFYALWDTESGTVLFRQVRYDRRPVEARMVRAGLG